MTTASDSRPSSAEGGVSAIRSFLAGLDRKLFFHYAVIVLPLMATQVLQRFEHVIDNRFITKLGAGALFIHSVNYNLFLVAQAVGVAASTSALIFWKREECARQQKSILAAHVRAAALASGVLALALFPLIPFLRNLYGVAPPDAAAADLYLRLGLLNMVLVAVYAPLNALLIASDQRMKSLAYIGGLIGIKLCAGWLALRSHGAGGTLALSLSTIAIGGTLANLLLAAAAWRAIAAAAGEREVFPFSSMRPVWHGELGTAAIRSATPFLYSYLLTRSQAGTSLLPTYQLTLHLAYILCLPQLSAAQLAVRDASAEASRDEGAGGLLRASWFRWFFAVGVAPSQLLLLCGMAFAPWMLRVVYGYQVPADQVSFLAVYFLAVAVGQWGNVYVVPLRAQKLNSVAMRNFLVSELGVMVLLTGVVVALGKGTPLALATVVLAYCVCYLAMNVLSVRAARAKAAA